MTSGASDTGVSVNVKVSVDVEVDADAIVRATLAIARTMRVAEGRLPDTLDAVVATATRITGCDAGLVLVENGVLVPTATSAQAPHELDLLQVQTGSGPCLTAATSQEVVSIDDTATDTRWAAFMERAVALGVASMVCVPLWAADQVLGTMSLYSDRPSAFAATERHTAEICAALAAAAIADARRSDQLRDAMSRRDLIGQAKGVLMERHKVTADQAFELLSHASQRANRKLAVVAQHLVDTGLLLGTPQHDRGTVGG